MTVSKKQLEANKKNAQKDGAKIPEGKAIVKYNALKHGLLAKEVVILIGMQPQLDLDGVFGK